MSGRIEGKLRIDIQIAALEIGEERLAPLGPECHRAPQPPRGPGHEHEFRIGRVAGAEISADIKGRDNPDLIVRDAEHRCQFVAELHDANSVRRVHRIELGRLVPRGRYGAGLHVNAGNALDPACQAHAMRGARKRRLRRRLVAEMCLERAIAGDMIKELWRSLFECVGRQNDRRQRLPIDRHGFGGVLRLRACFRHHHRDGFAGETAPVPTGAAIAA